MFGRGGVLAKISLIVPGEHIQVNPIHVKSCQKYFYPAFFPDRALGNFRASKNVHQSFWPSKISDFSARKLGNVRFGALFLQRRNGSRASTSKTGEKERKKESERKCFEKTLSFLHVFTKPDQIFHNFWASKSVVRHFFNKCITVYLGILRF